MARLLIVDDDLSLRQFLSIFLGKEGHEIDVAANGVAALERLEQATYDVVVTDIRMPRMGGLDLLDGIRDRDLPTQVIVMTAFSSTETALDAMRRGAYDYIVKPFKLDEVRIVVEKCLEKTRLVTENRQLKRKLEKGRSPTAFTYQSKAMADVVEMIERVASTPSNVLVLGESGTGKELVARMLHHRSPRASRPFVAINCGAIPAPLMESELFGHTKGAFTGATQDKKGLFEAATGGTVLLDEIGELSIGLQVKLLRVLQERTVTPVGSTSEVAIDVRVVASTHRDLREAVVDGSFRADLYYRLNVIEVRLPPLRERREDIVPLADHFLDVMNQRMGRDIKGFKPEARALLAKLPFNGNVRELENVIERAVALETSDQISAAWLPDPGSSLLLGDFSAATADLAVLRTPEELLDQLSAGVDRWLDEMAGDLDLEALVSAFEHSLLCAALRVTSGNKTDAARLLGVTFRSFRYKLAKTKGLDDS